MVELTLPDCEARVSPELLALLRGGPRKVLAAAPEACGHGVPVLPGEMTPKAPPARMATDPRWPLVSLRRDGARPMRFPGLMVASHSQSLEVQADGHTVPVERHLALYLAEAGEAVAHVACVPAEDQPARPVHRAARLKSVEDFAALLRVASPDTCFAVSRVAAQWKGQGGPDGPFHPCRPVPHPDNTE